MPFIYYIFYKIIPPQHLCNWKKNLFCNFMRCILIRQFHCNFHFPMEIIGVSHRLVIAVHSHLHMQYMEVIEMDFQKCQMPSFNQKLQDGSNSFCLCLSRSEFDFSPLNATQTDNQNANPWDWICATSGILLLSKAISILERHLSLHSISEYISPVKKMIRCCNSFS